MATFLNGPQHDLTIDRDREFTLIALQAESVVSVSAPLLELQRTYTRYLDVAAALVPTPAVSGRNVSVTFTDDQTGALNDLTGQGRPVFLKYRLSALVDGVRRTLICGRLTIVPVGLGVTVTPFSAPFTVNTGPIVIGDVTVTIPDDGGGGDPGDPGDTTVLDDAVLWQAIAGGFVEAWATDVFTTWV